MLEQLTIRNFAIIDHLELDWSAGFTAITGETGAGKSIIIDALGALLGDRLGAEVVRTGAERAVIEGLFSIEPSAPANLAAVLEEFGLEPEDGALIVTREIAGQGGRGGARVNGRTVPLSVLQELGEQLVDIHGQSQHMALLRPREQLDYLDRFGALEPLRASVAQRVRELRAVRSEHESLLASERQAAREQEVLRHQIGEIEAAQLSMEEETELRARRTRLQHAERLRQLCASAYEALTGRDAGEAEERGAEDLLGEAVSALLEGQRYDPTLELLADALSSALAQVEDSVRTLRTYQESLDGNPYELLQTEDRLTLIADLQRKYGNTIADVLGFMEHANQELNRYERREERLIELREADSRLSMELGSTAQRLSEGRVAAGIRLAEAVQSELGDLNMRGSLFTARVVQVEAADGVNVGGRTLAFDATGIDRVDLLVSANPGEEPRPIQRVASGGELARIALALKTVLSQADPRATLVFDEVDAGVGGRTAPVVGEKLWSIASMGHQVFCVTHMPQVAAFADHHLLVSKSVAGTRTNTHVARLEGDGAVDELASMLAGSATASARQSAREMLTRAAELRRTHASSAV